MQSLALSSLTVSYHEISRRIEQEARIKAAITVWRELREDPISSEYERKHEMELIGNGRIFPATASYLPYACE